MAEDLPEIVLSRAGWELLSPSQAASQPAGTGCSGQVRRLDRPVSRRDWQGVVLDEQGRAHHTAVGWMLGELVRWVERHVHQTNRDSNKRSNRVWGGSVGRRRPDMQSDRILTARLYGVAQRHASHW